MPIIRIFALISLISIVTIPEKEISELVGRETMEGESIQEKNSTIVSDRTAKDPFAAAVKIRATDREGNFIEVTY